MEWRLISEQRLGGAAAMAFDEIAAETVASGGPATVRLYRWSPSTLTLGYGTEPDEIDWAFCDSEGIDVTRRPTGGGGIYHDHVGDVAYSIVAPAEPFPSDVTDCYRQLCEPVLSAFERIGVDVDFADAPRAAIHSPACYLRAMDPRHDLTGPDGRKIAGNAQYRTREAIVQHGSLTFSVDADRHLGCFADPPDAETFRERVGGVDEYADVERADFVAALEAELADWAGADPGSWSDDERRRCADRVEAKFGADAWVRERTT